MTFHDNDDDPRAEEDEEEEESGDDPADEEPADESGSETQAAPQPAALAPNPVGPAAVGVGTRVDAQGKPVRRSRKKKPQPQPQQQQQSQPTRKPVDPDKPSEADRLWPWVMKKAEGKGVHPAYVTIRVARVDVGRETTVGHLGGDACLGDDFQTPDEALYNAIVDQFHMSSGARGPVLYNVIFSIKGDQGFSHRGQLRLPAPSEINQRRHQQWYPAGGGTPAAYGAPPGAPPGYVPPPPPRRHEGPRGYGRDDRRDYRDRDYDRDYDREREPRRGFGAPPPAPAYQPPPPPPGYYQQPPYPPQPPYREPPYRRDRDRDDIREELRELRGFMRDVLLDRSQQPQYPQQPAAPDWGAINSAVQQMEKTFGVKFTVQPPVQPQPAGLGAPPPGYVPPPGYGYPPQPQQQPSPERLDYDQTLARKVRSRIEKKVDSAIDQLFDPPPKPKEEEEEEFDDDAPKPDFETIETPVPFPGTQDPIRYARDRKTGDIHWFGTLMSNPQIVTKYGEKAMDIVGKLAEAARHAAAGGLGARPQMPQQTGLNGTQPPSYGSPPPPQQQPQQRADDDDGFKF